MQNWLKAFLISTYINFQIKIFRKLLTVIRPLRSQWVRNRQLRACGGLGQWILTSVPPNPDTRWMPEGAGKNDISPHWSSQSLKTICFTPPENLLNKSFLSEGGLFKIFWLRTKCNESKAEQSKLSSDTHTVEFASSFFFSSFNSKLFVQSSKLLHQIDGFQRKPYKNALVYHKLIFGCGSMILLRFPLQKKLELRVDFAPFDRGCLFKGFLIPP